RGQSLNMKDNGVNVIIGLREKGRGWDLAQQDGWVPGKTLFSLEEAAKRGTVVQYLLSDAGQKEMWPKLKPLLTKGKALYFSHGFSIVFSDQTAVVPPKDIDVILVAPKGSGTTVRRLFLEGRGINASFAVHQDATQSLYPLIGENGMDWMYANCSTTAQRGAIDWYPRFRDATRAVFEELYKKVETGEETRRVLESNSRPDYRQQLEKELKAIRE